MSEDLTYGEQRRLERQDPGPWPDLPPHATMPSTFGPYNRPPKAVTCRSYEALLEAQAEREKVATPAPSPAADVLGAQTQSEAFRASAGDKPTPMVLHCPQCKLKHVDEGIWATLPHRWHLCEACKHEWKPSAGYTVGVEEVPGAGAT